MQNILKTTLLLAFLTGLLVSVGYWFGGRDGATFALILSLVMNAGTYWFSDKLALATYHARQVTAHEAPRLHAIVEELARSADIPKPRIYLIDLPVPNAFATGRNPSHAALAVTQGILEALDERQLRAVIGHELGHVKNRDILIASVAATLAGALSYLAQMTMWGGGLFTGSSDDRRGGNAISMLIMIVLTPIVATLIHLAISRSREFHADETGAKITGAPRDLASALRTLDAYAKRYPLRGEPKHEATAHLFIVNPFSASVLSRLFSTHPTTEDRVERLEAMVV